MGAILYGTHERPHLHVCPSVLTSFVRFVPGMLIVLFSKSMTALFNPVYRKGESVKWGLVSYAVVAFSLATVFTASNLNIQSISYIDNRNFPGIEGALPPGPLGYMLSINSKGIGVLPNAIFPLNGWLADGFLVSFLFKVVPYSPDDQRRVLL